MSMLPTEKTQPSIEMNNLTFMVYGKIGIGKTTFCNELSENVLFLDTEKGTDLQSIFVTPVESWQKFLNVRDEFLRGNHKFEILAVDTVGRLLKECAAHVLGKMGLSHPSEGQYGKAYDKIKFEFDSGIHPLQHSPYGLWFIGHDRTKKIEPAFGSAYDRFEPDLPNYVAPIVTGLCDFIFYMTNGKVEKILKNVKDGKERKIYVETRVLKTKPAREHVAKDRLRYAPLPEQMILNGHNFKEMFEGRLKENMEKSSE